MMLAGDLLSHSFGSENFHFELYEQHVALMADTALTLFNENVKDWLYFAPSSKQGLRLQGQGQNQGLLPMNLPVTFLIAPHRSVVNANVISNVSFLVTQLNMEDL